ncbi:Uncharacterised protein [Anaerobiospirillum thomasii]|nr:Uncharacterised protein [Anaerobiospirillum thomasii]
MLKIALWSLSLATLTACNANCQPEPYRFDNGPDYVSDGLYRIVDCTGRMGFANIRHETVIAPRYAFAYPFKAGVAKVTDSGHMEYVEGSDKEHTYFKSSHWYLIDKTGKKIKDL